MPTDLFVHTFGNNTICYSDCNFQHTIQNEKEYKDSNKNLEKYRISSNIKNNKKHEITIDWVRHAESCANYYTLNTLDTNKKRNTGYKKLKRPASENISLGADKSIIQNLINKIKYSMLLHPVLSFVGMQHAIILGNMLKNQPIYDYVGTSATVRTIMTALIALRGTTYTIHVIPYVSEKLNIAGRFDYQNSPLDSTKLKRIVVFIKKWMTTNWVSRIDDIAIMTSIAQLIELIDNNNELVGYKDALKLVMEPIDHSKQDQVYNKKNIILDTLNKLKNSENSLIREQCAQILEMLTDKYIEGPNVDFTLLEQFEHNKVEADIGKFYSNILPKIQEQNNTLSRILIFGHGSAMKEHVKNLYGKKIEHPRNTQIFRERIFVQSPSEITFEPISINTKFFIPILIRSNYEDFESCNIDVCKTNGLQGEINYPLYDPVKFGDQLEKSAASPDIILTTDAIYLRNKEKYKTL